MSQVLLAIQNILQNSNIFDRCGETVLFMLFGDKKVTQFSGVPSTSVSYLKVGGKAISYKTNNQVTEIKETIHIILTFLFTQLCLDPVVGLGAILQIPSARPGTRRLMCKSKV